MGAPKRFLPRFAIRTLLIATAVCAIITAILIAIYQRRQLADRLKDANRMADIILVSHHWNNFDPFKTTPSMIQLKLNGYKLQKPPVFLFPNRSGANGEVPDSYESTLLSQIQNKEKTLQDIEVRPMENGAVVYYKSIRAHASCLTCHDASQTQPGEVLAVLKMTRSE